jgi:hypothetical protein
VSTEIDPKHSAETTISSVARLIEMFEVSIAGM